MLSLDRLQTSNAIRSKSGSWIDEASGRNHGFLRVPRCADAARERSHQGRARDDRRRVAGDNVCLYCFVARGAILRVYVKNPLIADQVGVNYLKAHITPRQRAMLAFALKIADRSNEITENDLQALRAQDSTTRTYRISATSRRSSRCRTGGEPDGHQARSLTLAKHPMPGNHGVAPTPDTPASLSARASQAALRCSRRRFEALDLLSLTAAPISFNVRSRRRTVSAVGRTRTPTISPSAAKIGHMRVASGSDTITLPNCSHASEYACSRCWSGC